MNRTYYNWNLTSGEKIHSLIATPNTPTRAVIILVHGLGEHIGRYDHVIDDLLTRHYAVIASDTIGHGESGGKRGAIHTFNDFYQVIDRAIIDARLHFAEVPVFLYGHSLGGLQVLSYVLRKQPEIAGVIATAPGLKLKDVPQFQITAVRALSKLLPNLTIKNGLALGGLSKDAGVVKDYIADKLVHNNISLLLALSLNDEGFWVRKNANQLRIPAFVAQGAKDILVDPSGTRELVELAGSNVTYNEYENGYHELHNDVEYNSLMEKLVNWIEVIIARAEPVDQRT